MNISHKLWPLVLQDVHQLTHFAISRSKNDLLKLLRTPYSDYWIEDESFQTLQIMAQLHIYSLEFRPSPKQIKQRKLAAQLWQLTGAIGSLQNLRIEDSLADNVKKQAMYQLLLVLQHLKIEMSSL